MLDHRRPVAAGPRVLGLTASLLSAVFIPATGAYLLHIAMGLVARVAPSMVPAAPLGRGGFFGAHWLWAWLLGAVPLALALIVSLFVGRRSVVPEWLRLAVGVLGAAALALAALDLLIPAEIPDPAVWRGPGLEPLWPALGAAAAMSVAVGWIRPVPLTLRGARWAAAGTIAAVLLALGLPTLAEASREVQREALSPFHLDLVAAYPYEPERTHAVVIDASGSPGQVVEWHGRRFNLHRGDHLAIDSSQVRRVRWLDQGSDGVWLAIRLDRRRAAALRQRSIHRMSQFDALFVNDRLVSVAEYEDVMWGRFMLHDPEPARLRALYRTLVGHDP